MRAAAIFFGAGDPGGHGGLLHQEGAGDLGGGKPAHQAQGQGDLGLPGQGGVAAGEDEREAFVGQQALLGAGRRLGRHQQGQGAAQHRFAAQDVQGPVAGGGREPGGRTVRDAGPGPGLERLGVRVLGALLGQVQVAGEPGGGGQHPGPVAAVGQCHRRDDVIAQL